MKSLSEQMLSYSAYHRNFWNKATHFVGVPIVVFSILLPLSWFRFAPMALPLSAATLFYLSVFVYYLRLDLTIAIVQAPMSLLLLYLADQVAQLPFGESFLWFLGTFVGGWIIQVLGHLFEGRKPALVDNLLQIFNAPLFLTAELLFFLGFQKQLKATVDAHFRG